MLQALQQPIEASADQGSTILDSLILGGAALGAALIAATVAAYWHRAQLRHDRELRNLAHARTIVNAAVETVASAIDAMSGLTMAARRADEAKREVQSIEGTDDKEAIERTEADAVEAIQAGTSARQKASTFLNRMSADRMRLRIALGRKTLGPKKTVVTSHQKLTEAFKKWFDGLAPQARDGQGPDYYDAGAAEIRPLLTDFEEACEKWSVAKPARRKGLRSLALQAVRRTTAADGKSVEPL